MAVAAVHSQVLWEGLSCDVFGGQAVGSIAESASEDVQQGGE